MHHRVLSVAQRSPILRHGATAANSCGENGRLIVMAESPDAGRFVCECGNIMFVGLDKRSLLRFHNEWFPVIRITKATTQEFGVVQWGLAIGEPRVGADAGVFGLSEERGEMRMQAAWALILVIGWLLMGPMEMWLPWPPRDIRWDCPEAEEAWATKESRWGPSRTSLHQADRPQRPEGWLESSEAGRQLPLCPGALPSTVHVARRGPRPPVHRW